MYNTKHVSDRMLAACMLYYIILYILHTSTSIGGRMNDNNVSTVHVVRRITLDTVMRRAARTAAAGRVVYSNIPA